MFKTKEKFVGCYLTVVKTMHGTLDFASPKSCQSCIINNNIYKFLPCYDIVFGPLGPLGNKSQLIFAVDSLVVHMSTNSIRNTS